jgi:hypothetical protein
MKTILNTLKSFFFGNNIRKGVMKIVEAKIQASQKRYNDGIESLEVKAKETIKEVEEKLVTDKVNLETELIAEITAKLIN